MQCHYTAAKQKTAALLAIEEGNIRTFESEKWINSNVP